MQLLLPCLRAHDYTRGIQWVNPYQDTCPSFVLLSNQLPERQEVNRSSGTLEYRWLLTQITQRSSLSQHQQQEIVLSKQPAGTDKRARTGLPWAATKSIFQ